jgi:hypothetical protein
MESSIDDQRLLAYALYRYSSVSIIHTTWQHGLGVQQYAALRAAI